MRVLITGAAGYVGSILVDALQAMDGVNLHEDGSGRVVQTLLTAAPRQGYEIFNASPEDYLAASDLASLLGKRTVVVPPALLRALFVLGWHVSRGRIPTPPGAWKFVTFPIAVAGSALTRAYGCRYQFTSAQALMARVGRHAAGMAATSAIVAPAPALAAVAPRSDVRRA